MVCNIWDNNQRKIIAKADTVHVSDLSINYMLHYCCHEGNIDMMLQGSDNHLTLFPYFFEIYFLVLCILHPIEY